MIIEAVVNLVLGFVQSIMDTLLPVGAAIPWTIPTGLLRGYAWLDAMAPLHEAIQVGVVLLGASVAVIAFRTLVTVRHIVLP